LGEVAKKDRKALLGLSFTGYAIIDINIIPTKIDSLGIVFSPDNKEAIPNVLAVLIGYFLIAFLVHSLSDFISYRRAKRVWAINKELQLGKEKPQDTEERISIETMYAKRNKLSPAPIALINWIKVIFEFYLPFFIGLFGFLKCL
jgi:hypothetical protein